MLLKQEEVVHFVGDYFKRWINNIWCCMTYRSPVVQVWKLAPD